LPILPGIPESPDPWVEKAGDSGIYHGGNEEDDKDRQNERYLIRKCRRDSRLAERKSK